MAVKSGSLVSNILKKSNTLDQKLLDTGTQNLCKKATELKEEMYEHVRQRYVEFQSYTKSASDLLEKLRDVESDCSRLDAKIGTELGTKIADAADKRREIEDSLRGVQAKIDFVRRLASLHEELQGSRRHLEEGDFTEAAGRLHVVTEDLNELAGLGCEARVFTKLQEETAMLSSETDMTLLEEWNRRVGWSPKSAPKNPPLSVTLETELRVPVSAADDTGEEGRSLSEIVDASKVLDTWPRIRSAFAKKLLHLAVRPLVLNPGLGITRQVEAGKDTLVVKFVKLEEEEEAGEEAEMSTEERLSRLYSRLATLFKVVGQVFPGDRVGWMGGIGREVWPEMARLIIDHHLATSVPKTAQELERYEQVKVVTSEFETGLAELGLVEAGLNKLSDFTRNIEVYYEEQKKKNLLESARVILKKSIHNTEMTASPEKSDPLPNAPHGHQRTARDHADPPDLDLETPEDQLKDFGAEFPSCAVSKCVKEFVVLLRETLHTCYAKETEDEKMVMFSTVRDMIDLFRAVFPAHHKEDVASIPAAATVFYNDCTYVVHHLILSSTRIQQNLSPRATFVDLILLVRRMGEDAFQAEMRKQRDSVLRTLKAFGSFAGVSEEEKRDEVYRGVRQGLFQITQLSRVYKETLPGYVHRDAVGNLLDVLVSYVVKGVLALEDIVSADAGELYQVLETVLEKGASVMQWSDEEEEAKEGELLLSLCCPGWARLQELSFVLDARLYEIVERWGEGKGSLARHFKAVEVRNLIKALFTNTDRRATALSKITV